MSESLILLVDSVKVAGAVAVSTDAVKRSEQSSIHQAEGVPVRVDWDHEPTSDEIAAMNAAIAGAESLASFEAKEGERRFDGFSPETTALLSALGNQMPVDMDQLKSDFATALKALKA